MVFIIQVLGRISRGFQDFFWVPRMDSPAGLAEDEVGHTLDEGDTIREDLATLPALYCGFVVHIRLRGKTRQTEGDFSDLFWVVLRFFSS